MAPQRFNIEALVGQHGSVEKLATGEGYCFAVTRKQDGVFMGACGLQLKDGRFELGYWLGKPFWRQGYATEAAKKVVSPPSAFSWMTNRLRNEPPASLPCA